MQKKIRHNSTERLRRALVEHVTNFARLIEYMHFYVKPQLHLVLHVNHIYPFKQAKLVIYSKRAWRNLFACRVGLFFYNSSHFRVDLKHYFSQKNKNFNTIPTVQSPFGPHPL